MMKQCPGCLSRFEKVTEAPVSHPYIGAIAECWDMFSLILAKEYNDPTYFKVHRTTVDAYCVQHIGNQDDRRARQSVNIHLIGLYLKFGQLEEEKEILKFLSKATNIKRNWPAVVQRQRPQWLTVQDIVAADSPSSHANLVLKWGQTVWEAYEGCHDDIVSLYQEVIGEENYDHRP